MSNDTSALFWTILVMIALAAGTVLGTCTGAGAGREDERWNAIECYNSFARARTKADTFQVGYKYEKCLPYLDSTGVK